MPLDHHNDPQRVGRADAHFAAENTQGPKGHLNGKVTETRQKSKWWILSIPPLGSPFAGVLHSRAGKTAGKNAELARTREKTGNFQRFPALAGSQAPQVATPLQSLSSRAAAPTSPKN